MSDLCAFTSKILIVPLPTFPSVPYCISFAAHCLIALTIISRRVHDKKVHNGIACSNNHIIYVNRFILRDACTYILIIIYEIEKVHKLVEKWLVLLLLLLLSSSKQHKKRMLRTEMSPRLFFSSSRKLPWKHVGCGWMFYAPRVNHDSQPLCNFFCQCNMRFVVISNLNQKRKKKFALAISVLDVCIGVLHD